VGREKAATQAMMTRVRLFMIAPRKVAK